MQREPMPFRTIRAEIAYLRALQSSLKEGLDRLIASTGLQLEEDAEPSRENINILLKRRLLKNAQLKIKDVRLSESHFIDSIFEDDFEEDVQMRKWKLRLLERDDPVVSDFRYNAYDLERMEILIALIRTYRSGADPEDQRSILRELERVRNNELEAFPIDLKSFEFVADGLSDLDMCAVCYEDFKSGAQCTKLPQCGHVFHLDCVQKWLRLKQTCPLCKAQVSPDTFQNRH